MPDKLDQLEMLYDEISYAKTQIRENGTGHIHTSIRWLEQRVEMVKEEIRSESSANLHA
jgi:hypothetical protein|tara:strand:+ start:2706 stop:2882 length:177 start_codon:yes stop_codon:yes gene_type:complete